MHLHQAGNHVLPRGVDDLVAGGPLEVAAVARAVDRIHQHHVHDDAALDHDVDRPLRRHGAVGSRGSPAAEHCRSTNDDAGTRQQPPCVDCLSERRGTIVSAQNNFLRWK